MWRARIVKGAIILPPALIEWARVQEGTKFLKIEQAKYERSIPQLRLYRAWLHKAAEDTGNDEEVLHEFLLERCAPRVVVTIKGQRGSFEVERTKRTSGGHALSMSKDEMADYMEKCAVLTCIPLPTDEELARMGYVKAPPPERKRIYYPKEDGNIPTQF